jgi:hypothetical protein|tara:strand:- start:592 stop:990 length:399 start_codon:yes stop_codon:yes gene_type:complete
VWQISAGLGLALALSLGGFKLYYDKAEAEKLAIAVQLKQSKANQALLETTIDGQNKNLREQKERTEVVLGRIRTLTEEHAESMAEVQSIREKFARHNMDLLSLRKPKLIQKIINKGTKEVLRDLETITSITP